MLWVLLLLATARAHLPADYGDNFAQEAPPTVKEVPKTETQTGPGRTLPAPKKNKPITFKVIGDKVVEQTRSETDGKVKSSRTITAIKNAVKDTEHIKEHFENKVDTKAPLKEGQVRYLYFTLYDTNKDRTIDGLEMMWALHPHDHHHETIEKAAEALQSVADDIETDNDDTEGIAVDEEAAYEIKVDEMLLEMDADNNGLVDYAEFRKYLDANEVNFVSP